MSARNLQQQGSGYQVHVFTPIVTGAPTKKPKFPNTAAPSARKSLIFPFSCAPHFIQQQGPVTHHRPQWRLRLSRMHLLMPRGNVSVDNVVWLAAIRTASALKNGVLAQWVRAQCATGAQLGS